MIEYNNKMPIVVRLIHILYDYCPTGGLCHIVTDDNNIDNDSLKFVINCCKEEENLKRIENEICIAICNIMLDFTLEQRAALFYFMEEGYYYIDNDLLDENAWIYFWKDNEFTKSEYFLKWNETLGKILINSMNHCG